MPLYVYLCSTCGTSFEKLRTFSERLEPADCPACQSEARFALSLSTPSYVASGADACCRADGGEPAGGCCGGGCGCN